MAQNKFKIYSWILIALCAGFLVLYGYHIYSIWWTASSTDQLIFNWPDANANYFFARIFAESNILFSFESLNLATDNLLHTRSINVIDGWLVPMTFLPAIVIFGLVFKLTGALGILWLTPLLAATTVYLFFRLCLLVFRDLDLSFIAALLLLTLAPWMYFSTEVMLPTILFIFLLIFGLFGLFYAWEKSDRIWFIIGSWLVILALMVRPVEAIWLLPLLVLIFYRQRHKIKAYQLVFSALILLTAAGVTLLLNKSVYGGWLTFGYLNLQDQSLPTEFASQGSGIFARLKLIFFPFGWDTRELAANVWKYQLKLLWPYYFLALLSLWWLKSKLWRRSEIWRNYFLATAITFIIIIVYYANWHLADTQVLQYNSISISYVRYFLPLYILLLPFAAKAILSLTAWHKLSWRLSGRYFLVLVLIIFSFKLAWLSPNDGIIRTNQYLQQYYQQFLTVQMSVPKNAVLITERSDKIFFPYYRVIVPQGDLPLWPRVAKIIQSSSIYFYTAQTEEQLGRTRQLAAESNLELLEIQKINDEFTLYQIKAN